VQKDRRERVLQSGDAFFAWDLAVLRLPPSNSDPDGTRILHEHAHVLTFAGTDFYTGLASEIIEAKELTFGHISESLQNSARAAEIQRRGQAFARFAEAVPDALRKLGERTFEGTLPDSEVVRNLEECVRRYRERFDVEWTVLGLDPASVWGPAAAVGGLDAQKLFNRFILLTFVHAILDATVAGPKREKTPDQITSALRATLMEGDLLIPVPGMKVADHVRGLLGIGKRDMVTMFNDHFRLASVLLNATDEALHRYIGLLPATVGLEFLVECWPEGVQTSFFSNSFDQPIRRRSYLARRLRDAPRLARLSAALDKLDRAFVPRFDGLPIRSTRRARNDPTVQGELAVWTMRSFFSALPEFLAGLLAEAPMFEAPRFAERLRWIAETSDQAVSAYLKAAATELGVPELAIEVDPGRLRKADHLEDGPIWLIDSKGG